MSEQENKSLDAVSSWLKQSAESKDWKYFNYSQENDFAQLWEIGTGAGERNKTSPLLIDWNGFPDERPPFPKILEFITPLDWALAVAYKQVVANFAAPGLPQVVIVDRCSHRYPGSFAVEMRRAVADALPHIHIFSALSDDDNEDALAFVKFLQSSPMLAKQPRLGQMQALRQAWIGYTVQSGDHHDLSNILGPLVLSTGFKDSMLRNGLLKDKSAQALLQKIKWSDMGGGEGDPQDKWFDFAQYAAKIVRDSRVKIILVDDQANQGWLDIVSAAVGAERSDASEASENEIKHFAKSAVVDVWASTSYQAIRDCLEKARISDKEGSNINGDQRFKFSLTGEGAEILLLDLRLLSDEQEEIQYFRWALGVAKNLKRANEAAFPGMDCDGLGEWIDKAEKGELANWRKKPTYLELLTLLPRILATVDMSLPIVIFSSTGQRQVAELLKLYGNIITVFEKPRFFGYVSDDIAGETQDKFSLALASAVKMLHARKSCIDLIDVPKLLVQPIQGGKYNHVEIFIDEDHPDDGNLSQIYVGGCIAIYVGDSKEDALAKADKFDEVLVTGGARYFDDLGIGKKSPRIKAKKSAMKSELEMAMQAPSAPKFLGVVRLLRQQMEADGVAGDMTADNHFRRTLGVLLEVFLCEVLPRLFHNGCSKDDTSTSIFVGTRVKFYNERKRAAFEEAKSRLGLSGFSSQEGARENYYLTSMDRGGVFPIIADLHQFRHPRTEIERSIGVMLCYHTPIKKRTYPLHFICRNCKEVVSYNRKDVRTTESSDVKASELPENVAKVMFLNSDKGFGFIQPIGGEKVMCYRDNWTDFSSASVKGWVTYNSIQSTQKGLQALGIRPVDEGTLNKIKSASMISILSSQPTCQCSSPDFVPDYRALHYLADEALDKFPSEANSPYSMLKIIFDDNLDKQLESLVEAGRELDNGDIVSALIKVSHALHNDQPIGNAGGYILARFPDVLENITNQDYWRMAQRLCENPGLFITLAGLSEKLTDDQVKKIVEDLLREEFAQFFSLSIDIARSLKNKRVCKVSSIPEHVSQEIYAKLFARAGADTWRNCTKPTAP